MGQPSQPELYPNMCQRYLVGTLSAGQHVKFMCMSGMLLVEHRQYKLRQVATPACIYSIYRYYRYYNNVM